MSRKALEPSTAQLESEDARLLRAMLWRRMMAPHLPRCRQAQRGSPNSLDVTRSVTAWAERSPGWKSDPHQDTSHAQWDDDVAVLSPSAVRAGPHRLSKRIDAPLRDTPVDAARESRTRPETIPALPPRPGRHLHPLASGPNVTISRLQAQDTIELRQVRAELLATKAKSILQIRAREELETKVKKQASEITRLLAQPRKPHTSIPADPPKEEHPRLAIYGGIEGLLSRFDETMRENSKLRKRLEALAAEKKALQGRLADAEHRFRDQATNAVPAMVPQDLLCFGNPRDERPCVPASPRVDQPTSVSPIVCANHPFYAQSCENKLKKVETAYQRVVDDSRIVHGRFNALKARYAALERSHLLTVERLKVLERRQPPRTVPMRTTDEPGFRRSRPGWWFGREERRSLPPRGTHVATTSGLSDAIHATHQTSEQLVTREAEVVIPMGLLVEIELSRSARQAAGDAIDETPQQPHPSVPLIT